ncbi:MAG: DMT family transporter [Flavobacteriia bacterium]|nr:DMT family transporter [Flavobacteriia bacterium]
MKNNQTLINAGIFLLLALTWGSSFILMKKGLVAFDGVQVALLRIVYASLFILAIGWRRLNRFQKKDTAPILLVGFFGNGIPYVFFAWALMHIDSSIAGITNSLTPLFTLIVGAVVFRTRIRVLQVLGIIIGLTGALYMLNPSENVALGDNWPYALLTVAASFMYSIGINTISAKLQHLDSITITLLALVTVGIPAVFGLLLFTDFVHIVTTNPDALASLGYIAILGVMGTGVAIILFNYLIKKASALYAVSITYLVPIVALGWGFVDGEIVTPAHLIGIAAILTGVYLVNVNKMKKATRG